MQRRRFLRSGLACLGSAAGFGATAGCLGRGARRGSTQSGPRTIHVEAGGGGLNPDGSSSSPFPTITRALRAAGPGDTVQVGPGEYAELVQPPKGGEPGAPITITGPPDAVLKSAPSTYNVVLIRRSHVHLTGLTIDGLQDPTRPESAGSYSRAQLVQVRPPTDTDDYLEDVVIAPHRIGNSQKSLVSVERTRDVEVGPFRVIGPAGAKYLFGDQPGHNGEIVYLGTSPSNLGSDWHPWTGYDRTRGVRVHHVDNSAGHPHSEIVNAKLGTHDVTIEYCTDGGGARNTEDSPSASVRLQSYGATLRWCDLRDGNGIGIEVASHNAHDAQAEKPADELTEAERRGGRDNAIYGNRVAGFPEGAILFVDDEHGQTAEEQRIYCGNEVEGDADGRPARRCPDSVPEGDGVGHTGGDSPWG